LTAVIFGGEGDFVTFGFWFPGPGRKVDPKELVTAKLAVVVHLDLAAVIDLPVHFVVIERSAVENSIKRCIASHVDVIGWPPDAEVGIDCWCRACSS
jgi:hypothetical protein